MAESILFSTSEAVIEVLWDIALALFIIRISFIYFILPFLTGLLFSYWTTTRLVPVNHFTPPQSELIVLPPQLLSIVIWAKILISYYEIPRSFQFRLAVGGLSTVFMIIAEAISALFLYAEGSQGWLWERDYIAAALFASLLVAFCFMPAWLMVFEAKHPNKNTHHGHENKNFLNALPTIAFGRKEKAAAKKSM